MYSKKHEKGLERVLAVADKELIGRELKKGGLCFEVSEAFYKGSLVTEQELAEMIEDSVSVNLVGEKAVRVAFKKGLILKENVIVIQGVPHAQIYRM